MALKSEESSIDLSGELSVGSDLSIAVKDKNLRQRIMALTLSNPAAREWFRVRRENIRSWTIFLDTKSFSAPNSMSQATKRVVRNIDHFQSNYLFVFVGLILYCIITSPLLLIAIATVLGACYILKVRNDSNRFHIFGRELTLAQQYGIVSLVSFPLFYIVGAGSVVFWVLGASFFVIMMHAIFYGIENRGEEEFDLQMEPV